MPRRTQLLSVEGDKVSVARTIEDEGAPDGEGTSGGRGIYWLLKNIVLGPAMRKMFRPTEDGTDNVPAHGPAILACNHLSYAD